MTDLHTRPLDVSGWLRAANAGRAIGVITPDDVDYDEARRVFNAAVDHRPAVIVRPVDAGEVAAAVRVARDHDLELAVRGGGHGFAGHASTGGGLVIDLSSMHGLEIDPEGRTAWAQGGLTTGAYTAQAFRHGLATSFGDTPTVGVSGLTLGGGIGWFSRRHGLTIDHVLAAEVVTAAGEVVRADTESHPELFWALRGGGGNLGVVTGWRYRLHPAGTVLGGMLVLPADPAVLAGVAAAASAAPDELSLMVHAAPAPPLPDLPTELHGRIVVFVMVCWSGDTEEGQRVLAPIRALATPLVDAVRPIPYPDMFEDEEMPPVHVTTRSTFLDRLDEATAATVLGRVEAAPPQVAAFQLRILGGAVARVPADATAFAHRDRGMLVTVAAASMGADDGRGPDRDAWADGVLGVLRQAGASGAFVSFMMDEGQERVREAYPDGTYERLAQVKRRYDPTNLFRRNQNVAPSAAGGGTAPVVTPR